MDKKEILAHPVPFRGSLTEKERKEKELLLFDIAMCE